MEIVADLCQRHICVSQEILRFLHAAFGDILANILSGLRLEFCCGVGPAFSNMGSHLRNSYSLGQMGSDVLHTGEYFFGYTLRKLRLRHPAGEVDEHIELEVLNGIDRLQPFAFLNVGVDELIGLLYIHAAGNRAVLAHHGDSAQKQVLCLLPLQ